MLVVNFAGQQKSGLSRKVTYIFLPFNEDLASAWSSSSSLAFESRRVWFGSCFVSLKLLLRMDGHDCCSEGGVFATCATFPHTGLGVAAAATAASSCCCCNFLLSFCDSFFEVYGGECLGNAVGGVEESFADDCCCCCCCSRYSRSETFCLYKY